MQRSVASEMSRAPMIVEELAPSYTIREGKPISLEVCYEATPKADVIWMRDNQQIDLNLMGLSKDFKVSDPHTSPFN